MATQTPRGGRGCTLLARADARFSLPDHSSDADVATPLYGKSVGALSVAWLPATRWATSSLRPPSAAGSLRRALRFKRQRADVGEGDRGLRVGREWSRCHGVCLGENRRCRVRAWHKCRSHRAVRDAREWRSVTSRGSLRGASWARPLSESRRRRGRGLRDASQRECHPQPLAADPYSGFAERVPSPRPRLRRRTHRRPGPRPEPPTPPRPTDAAAQPAPRPDR